MLKKIKKTKGVLLMSFFIFVLLLVLRIVGYQETEIGKENRISNVLVDSSDPQNMQIKIRPTWMSNEYIETLERIEKELELIKEEKAKQEELKAQWSKIEKGLSAKIRKDKETAQRIAEEEVATRRYYTSQNNYSNNNIASNNSKDSQGEDGVLNKRDGVNYYNGNKESYYSQRVLPGGGLNIPGRHVASDGTVRDADGYIVVASDNQAKGTVVDTSLGEGKVYDTGVGHDGVDVYTDW